MSKKYVLFDFQDVIKELSQIVQLFKIYLNEQINLFTMTYDPNEVEAFEADREFRLKIFNKKVRQLWKNQCCDKTSELDDLLK